MSDRQYWYVIKEADGTCRIAGFSEKQSETPQEQWGDYSSESEAIAKRVGLIRAGKCQPQ